MIQANELRIGNCVTDAFYDSFHTIIKIDSINDKGINLEIEDDGNYPECASSWITPEYKFKDLFGIPITPEILNKCSIEESSFINQYRFCGHYLEKNNDNSYSVIIGDEETPILAIKYVHQLQNAHYMLEEKELTINI